VVSLRGGHDTSSLLNDSDSHCLPTRGSCRDVIPQIWMVTAIVIWKASLPFKRPLMGSSQQNVGRR